MALPPKPPKFAIYPGVGIARVGDSPEYYLHPDEPTLDLYPIGFKLPFTPLLSTKVGKFRDPSNRIRRQGARFRVYEVKWKKYNGKTWIPSEPVKQIKAGGDVELRWKVSVSNAKHFTAYSAAPSLTPPPLATRTRLDATADISSKPPLTHKVLTVPKAAPARPNDIVLGAVTVDGDGNLIFVGGEGQCFSDGTTLIPGSVLFQAKWFDDVCDGRIECEVFEGGVSKGKALPAWVVTGKPAFSQAMPEIESLYDVARVMAVNRGIWPFDRNTSFVRDVYPVIRAVERLRWTSILAQAHSTAPPLVNKSAALAKFADKADATGKTQRQNLFNRLAVPKLPLHSYRRTNGPIDEDFDRAFGRARAARPTTTKNMPMMWDTFLVGTKYLHMHNLANDKYADDYDPALGVPARPLFTAQTPFEQLDTLNRAHMETMLGGSNMPGLEVGFRVGEDATWMMAFRIDHSTVKPGDITASLSVPWPKDYSACSDGDRPLEWWPPGRPISVIDAAGVAGKRWSRKWSGEPGNTIATAWKGLGFLKLHPASGEYREDERTLP